MVDVIIVNWNSGDFLQKSIDSIFSTNNEDYINAIFIIDNNSTDGSINKITANKKIKIIRNETNNGFSKACNQGFKLSTSAYVLLLNPDTRLLNNTIPDCITFMNQNNQTDILGCQLLNDKGEITYSCSRFPTPLGIISDSFGLSKIAPSVFKPGIILTNWDHTESRYVDQVMGAFMFIRKSIFDKIGFFDERFFVYYEEVDFSKRLSEFGGKSFFNADIKAIHIGQGTTSPVKGFRLFLNLRSRIQYAKKHFNFIGYCSVCISTFFIEPITRTFFLLFSGKISEISDLFKGYKLLVKGYLKN
jgi:N-acetylglucosaminyl-diphospho-decaprenol L-rhamnosyltransferase